MNIDARAACAALELLPADLADLMRREAARRLIDAAAALDDDVPPSVDRYAQIDGMLANARDMIFRAAAFEALWGHATPDDSNDERAASVTEANPHARPATPQSPVPPVSSQSSSVTQQHDAP